MSLHNEIDEMIQEDPRNAMELPVYVKFIEDFSVGFYGLKTDFEKSSRAPLHEQRPKPFIVVKPVKKITTKTRCQPVIHKTGKRLTVNVYSKALVPINSRMVGQQVFAFFFREQEELIWTSLKLDSFLNL